MDYSTLDDEALVRLIARAHADALGELYDRYNRLVFGLAFNVINDRLTAEEITMDVFTSIWQKAATYRPEQAKVSTWLISIARYRAIDVLRREKVRPERFSVSWLDVSPNAVPRDNNPEELTELSLERQRIHEALAQLPPEQKQTVTLAYFGGYTQRQIAEASGQPLGTVKTRIRLAMQKLRQILQDEQISV